jgi:hypothetical protein
MPPCARHIRNKITAAVMKKPNTAKIVGFDKVETKIFNWSAKLFHVKDEV